ncbi:Hypp1009 [Branchiostoma lanceolatum]|uniref:Hypp1009 protein n=1 Tax=Branchiostoma lanceolatum TaxID=7740 RepID=A0A8J9ZDU6_BRALA|nr:Hypp1009 [Branchiostoma lanceolatum]
MASERHLGSCMLLVSLCFAATVFSDPATTRHRHSEACANCISGDEGGGKVTTLKVFWDEIKSAVKDVEVEIATKRKEGKWVDKSDPKEVKINAKNMKKTKVSGSWSAVARLSARVSRLETNMSLVLDQNHFLRSEVANLSAQMGGSKGQGQGKRRHLRNNMEHLEESIGYVEMELDNERSKMNRYQTELSTIAVRQVELESKMAALARKITHNPRRKHSSVTTNVIAPSAPDVSVDETEYDYDVEFVREPKGQR